MFADLDVTAVLASLAAFATVLSPVIILYGAKNMGGYVRRFLTRLNGGARA